MVHPRGLRTNDLNTAMRGMLNIVLPPLFNVHWTMNWPSVVRNEQRARGAHVRVVDWSSRTPDSYPGVVTLGPSGGLVSNSYARA